MPQDAVKLSLDRLIALEKHVQNLTSLLQRPAKDIETPAQASENQQQSYRPGNSVKDVPTKDVGYLSQQGGGRFRYVSPTFWAAICQQVDQLDEILCADTDESDNISNSVLSQIFEPNPATRDWTAQSSSNGTGTFDQSLAEGFRESNLSLPNWIAQGQFSAAQILWQHLPSRQNCDELIHWYFQGCHPLVPLVDREGFLEEYDRVWEISDAEIPKAVLPFLTLLVALLYAGSLAHPSRQMDQSFHFHKLTKKALELARFPGKPTLHTLRAYIICQSMSMCPEHPLSSIEFVGLALRVANILGLHRDPIHFSKFSPSQAEERRRTWWHLVHIDFLISTFAGLPYLVDLLSSDVALPSSLNHTTSGLGDGQQRLDYNYMSEIALNEKVMANAENRDILSKAKIQWSGELQHYPKWIRSSTEEISDLP